MVTNLSYKLSVLFLFIISIFSIILLVLMFYPQQIIHANQQPYLILNANKTVQRGDFLIYQVDACKDRDIDSTVKRVVVIEGVGYDLTPARNNVSKGCNKTNVAIQIPMILPPGKAHIDLSISYKVNALRDETYYFRTENFTITR